MKTIKDKPKRDTKLALNVVKMCTSSQPVNRVLREFAKRLGICPLQITIYNKSSGISDIRYLYCKLRCENHGLSYSAIGREINRAYPTVIYGVKRINDLLDAKDDNIVEKWNKVKDIPGGYSRDPIPLVGT